jgi:hypothetical protein
MISAPFRFFKAILPIKVIPPCQHITSRTITKAYCQGENKKPQDLSHGFKKKKAVGAVADHGPPSLIKLDFLSGQAMDSL